LPCLRVTRGPSDRHPVLAPDQPVVLL